MAVKSPGRASKRGASKRPANGDASVTKKKNGVTARRREAAPKTVSAVWFQAVIECAPVAMFVCNGDLEITYLNDAARKLADTLSEHLPVGSEAVVGASLDAFHPNPAEWRRIITDLTNLPHRTVLVFGPQSVEVLVTPIFDPSGSYLGPLMTWEVVTERVEVQKKTSDMALALANSSSELTSVAQQMSVTAEQTAQQARTAATAAEEVKDNIRTVATSTEEMSTSIREIARNALDAARIADQAVAVAERTTTTITQLGDSSSEIGQVVKVITGIAQQTNLLALNATIEAARAGEVGKGFAVVANEVKELAKETARATEDISRRVEAIQSDTSGAVNAIGEISSIIRQINEVQSQIAGAVEEQTVTSNDMARSVNRASDGMTNIVENIGGVAAAAKQSAWSAQTTQVSAEELSAAASVLENLVTKMIGNVKQ